jgi:hypothetical protein
MAGQCSRRFLSTSAGRGIVRSMSTDPPSAPVSDRLTLGALYREMRNGLGDRGDCRVTVEFQQRSSMAPVVDGRRTQPGTFTKRVLTAEVDFTDLDMARCTMTLSGASGRPHARFVVQRDGDLYAYTLDGEAWGKFLAAPEIFDLRKFEEELGLIPVTDVTVEQALEARRLREALDIDLDPSAFDRLLRVFNADRDKEGEDDLDLGAFSVTIAGGEDLSLLYWWSLTGFEREPRPSGAGADTYACKVTCSVTIRLSALSHVEASAIRYDAAVTDVGSLDEVWAVARRHAGPPPVGD